MPIRVSAELKVSNFNPSTPKDSVKDFCKINLKKKNEHRQMKVLLNSFQAFQWTE